MNIKKKFIDYNELNRNNKDIINESNLSYDLSFGKNSLNDKEIKKTLDTKFNNTNTNLDNTKRNNLDFSHYLTPSNRSSSGFGDTNIYGSLLYGGISTRNENEYTREVVINRNHPNINYQYGFNLDDLNSRGGIDTRNNKKVIINSNNKLN